MGVIRRIRPVPGGTDRYGDPIEGTETVAVIPDAFVAPRTSENIDDAGRAGVIVGLTLYFPHGFDLERTDLVDVDGVRYRIEGEPGHYRNPFTGWQAGATVALVRTEG